MSSQHLDSSIVIRYLKGLLGTKEERRHSENRKAVEYIQNSPAPFRYCVAAEAEVIRHFSDEARVATIMPEHFKPPLHLTPRTARRWARLQYRSSRVMGDNDAWVAAVAIDDGGIVVGHDDEAFKDRPGLGYINFLKA